MKQRDILCRVYIIYCLSQMAEYPPIRIIGPSQPIFQNPSPPSPLPNSPVRQQLLHRTKVTIVKQQDEYLPINYQPNIKKKVPVKNMLQYKRQRYYTISNVEKIDEDLCEEENSTELEEPHKKNSVEISKKEMFVEEMKEINRNYSLLMKEFKKSKPLYVVKEQQFKVSEKVKFELKREEVLRKLKEYYKPISFQEIDEHQKSYLRNRPSFGSKRQNDKNYESIGQLKESPKMRYKRGKSCTVSVEQTRSQKQQLKQSEDHHSISKMRDHYDKILNRSRRTNLQSRSLKRKHSMKIEPSTIQSSSPSKREFNRRPSRSINYQSTDSLRPNKIDSPSSIFVTATSSPKHNRGKKKRLFKFSMNEVESTESREEEKEGEEYQLARFGTQSYLDEEYEVGEMRNEIN